MRNRFVTLWVEVDDRRLNELGGYCLAVLVLCGDRGGRIADIKHTRLSVAAGIRVVVAAMSRSTS